MEDLSSSFEEQLNKYKTVNDTCSIHGIQLVQIGDYDPFCPVCAREVIQETNENRKKNAVERMEKRNGYDWLHDKSIFADNTLKQATFDSYEVEKEEETKNKRLAMKLADKYINNETFNTIMTGTPGAGKSHLAMALLHKVNEESRPYKKCLFVSVDEIMRRIKNSFNNKESIYTEEFVTQLCAEPDVLVLDDLGAETGNMGSQKQATDFTSRTLYAIVNSRLNKNTIITTNLNNKQLTNMYDRKLLSRMYKGVKANGSLVQFKETTDKRLDLDF